MRLPSLPPPMSPVQTASNVGGVPSGVSRSPSKLPWKPNRRASDSVSDTVSAVEADSQRGRVPPYAIDADGATAPHRTDFDVVFDDHYVRLVRALTIVAGDAESAADAVQEAFVKAHVRWRKISRYEDPVGWIRRVAINHVRDDHRRSGRKSRAMQRLTSQADTSIESPPIDEFDRLLAELPRQQRATTALFYVDGLTVAEIATALEIAEGTVKSHLHDARRRLRPVLENEQRRWNGSPEEGSHE